MTITNEADGRILQPEHSQHTEAWPFISAIIPSYNEERYIAACLDSIIASTYPRGRLEVLVADGGSGDSTRRIVQAYTVRQSYIRLLDNPSRTLAAAWNVGIRAAQGTVIIAMNAHATVDSEFLSKCVKYLRKYGADCVGPVLVTRPQEDTHFGRAIAAAMAHPFGVGNSRFRTGVKDACWVDTVHFGAYKRTVFDRIGLYNEELVRSQDIELNLRLRRAGGRILLAPDISIEYFTRSTPQGFLKFGFLNGFWATYPLGCGTVVTRLRHLVPPFFVFSLLFWAILSLGFPELRWVPLGIFSGYTLSAVIVSMMVGMVRHDLALALILPLVFMTYHLTYGLGAFAGLLMALKSRRFWRLLREML